MPHIKRAAMRASSSLADGDDDHILTRAKGALDQPGAPTLERARELLEIGVGRGLKILYCGATPALKIWRGQCSPLLVAPEKRATEEILDIPEVASESFCAE